MTKLNIALLISTLVSCFISTAAIADSTQCPAGVTPERCAVMVVYGGTLISGTGNCWYDAHGKKFNDNYCGGGDQAVGLAHGDGWALDNVANQLTMAKNPANKDIAGSKSCQTARDQLKSSGTNGISVKKSKAYEQCRLAVQARLTP